MPKDSPDISLEEFSRAVYKGLKELPHEGNLRMVLNTQQFARLKEMICLLVTSNTEFPSFIQQHFNNLSLVGDVNDFLCQVTQQVKSFLNPSTNNSVVLTAIEHMDGEISAEDFSSLLVSCLNTRLNQLILNENSKNAALEQSICLTREQKEVNFSRPISEGKVGARIQQISNPVIKVSATRDGSDTFAIARQKLPRNHREHSMQKLSKILLELKKVTQAKDDRPKDIGVVDKLSKSFKL